MYCPNCGKEIDDSYNFCKYCGANLKADIKQKNPEPDENQSIENANAYNDEIFDTEEEFVLFEVKKHWMALFLPSFMTPIFLYYFWNIFLTTHGFLGYIVVIGMLACIIYPAARFKNDRFVITNKFAHIKIGLKDIKEFDIPIDKFDVFETAQSSVGKILDYGCVTFINNSEKYEYNYIESPDCVQRIFNNPKKYLSNL